MQRCAQQFWIVSEVELDPTSETVARNVSRNIGMGGHTLKHCVARDVSANVSGNVAPCVRAFTLGYLWLNMETSLMLDAKGSGIIFQ